MGVGAWLDGNMWRAPARRRVVRRREGGLAGGRPQEQWSGTSVEGVPVQGNGWWAGSGK
jgi:hypothetical protein